MQEAIFVDESSYGNKRCRNEMYALLNFFKITETANRLIKVKIPVFQSKIPVFQSILHKQLTLAVLWGRVSLSAQIYSFLCSFQEKMAKSYVDAPFGGDAPVWEILDPPLISDNKLE